METTAQLRQDHEILRAKLALLEGLLPLAAQMQYPIRELIFSIARRLRCHTEKETVLLRVLRVACHGDPAEATRYLPEEHQDQQQTLAFLNQLLAMGSQCPAEPVATYGAHLIDGLREHMAREDAVLFPAADRAIGEAEGQEVVMEMRAIARHHFPEGEPQLPILHLMPPIVPEMTVNHVLRIHPFARDIFRTFQVDWLIDGGHCLDELYWRRGVDVEALLHALNQSATTQTTVS